MLNKLNVTKEANDDESWNPENFLTVNNEFGATYNRSDWLQLFACVAFLKTKECSDLLNQLKGCYKLNLMLKGKPKREHINNIIHATFSAKIVLIHTVVFV